MNKTLSILVNRTGGSQYEATVPQYTFGPYDKEECAQILNSLNEELESSEECDDLVLNIIDTQKVDKISDFLEDIR